MENRKSKVIIVGARGMLGQALVAEFKKNRAYFVLAWDREEIDISDQVSVQKKISSETPFLIINAAANNAVDKIEEDETAYVLAQKTNSEGPRNLALAAKKNGAVLVHYVSDYVFDGTKKEYLETDLPRPISRYGETKLAGEENVRKTIPKHYLIRTSKLFGTPADSETAKKSFFAVMVDLARAGKKIRVIDDELSCFTYVDDLARATRLLVEKKFPYGTYHLVNEGAETWYGALRTFFQLAGWENFEIERVRAEQFLRPAKRPKWSVLKNTKFPRLRSWRLAASEWLKKEKYFLGK